MKPERARIVGLVVLGTVVGMLLAPSAPVGAVLWPPTPHAEPPTPGQIPFLIVLSIVQSLALGTGLAFLALGRPLLARVRGVSRGLARATHLAVAWSLLSWVPHDALHIHHGMDMAAIIRIDYAFHVTLILAAMVTAVFFLKALAALPQESTATGARPHAEGSEVQEA